MKCIYCEGDTYKDGKMKESQKYVCKDCNRTFTEVGIVRRNKEMKRRELIRKLYVDNGLSTTEIGKILNVSSTVPQRILKSMGVTRSISEAKSGKKRGTKLSVDEIIKLYKSGKSSNDISKKMGCSKRSVLTVLIDNNISRNNNYNYEHPMKESIENLYKSGYSLLKVSDKLGISYSSVRTSLNNSGLIRTEDRFGIGMNYDKYLESLPAYKKYRIAVNKVTNKQPIYELKNSDKPRGLMGVEGAYQLDHKYSIIEGFKNAIDPKIIGHIKNLEFIPWEENLNKGSNCSITIEKLIESIRVKKSN